MGEYSKSMAVMLAEINKRYIIGIMAWLDTDPELSGRDQELEQHIIQVWTDGLSIQRFQEVLREYYRFWLKVIKDYKGRKL